MTFSIVSTWFLTLIASVKRRWVFYSLLSFGIMAVVSSYTSLSETADEIFHISCGLQWLREGRYTIQPLHPPMARVMDALLPYLREVFFGSHTLGKRDGYMVRMVLSRLGSLPYYIFSCVLVFMWAKRLFGEASALWSLGLYVTLSSVTAHAMLATTDIGYTAMFMWATLMSVLWLEMPTPKRSFWLGVSLALMVGTKFSGLLHWPLAFCIILLAQVIDNYRKDLALSPLSRRHIAHCFIYILPCFIVVLWLVYACDFEPLIAGVKSAVRLDTIGIGVWFYGPLNNKAVWSFFPTVFFYKTPLAFLASVILGVWLSARQVYKDNSSVALIFPVLVACILLLSSMTSNINLGVRHVLPLYPLLAIVGGYGLWRLWRAGVAARSCAFLLIFSQIVGFCMYQPEHLAYFNIAAGEHPENITLDSDFDWGQSMIFLNDELTRRQISAAHLCVRKDAVWGAQFVVSAKMLPCPEKPVTGWLAISRAWRLMHPNNFAWLSADQQVEKIGKTMDLYYIPPRKEQGKPVPPAPVNPRGKTDIPAALKLFAPAFTPIAGATTVPDNKPSLTPVKP